MTEKVEHNKNSSILEGIHIVIPDDKNRINIPSVWKNFFPVGSTIILLWSGNYFVVMSKDIYKSNPDIIVHRNIIDTTGRLIIGDKVLKSFGLEIGKEVGLIGKGNHLELYLDTKLLREATSRSQQAVQLFQTSLIGKL